MSLYKVWSFFSLFFLGHSSFSQKIKFEPVRLSDNSSMSVNAILKDSYGFMWFGTYDRLIRYDGYSEDYFLYQSKGYNIPKADIRCLMESNDSLLLVGTFGEGLFMYKRSIDRFENFRNDKNNLNSLNHNYVLAIHEDKSKNIWIATKAGLERFDPENKTFVHYYPFGKGNFVAAISEDKQGNLWLYGGSKICKFDPLRNTYDLIHLSENPELNDILNLQGMIRYDRENNLWIGNKVEGLIKYQVSSGKIERFNEKNKMLKSNLVSCIWEDSKGEIWIGTDGGGLHKYQPAFNNFQFFEHDPKDPATLSSNAVHSIYESDPGIFWIGFYAEGVSLYKENKKKFMTYGHRDGWGKSLSNKSVLSFAESDDEKIWIGTDGGGMNVFDLKTQSFVYYTEENGKTCANVVKSLMQDSQGNIWSGSYRKGLCRINPSKGELKNYRFNKNDSAKSISNDNVWALCEGSEGKIWIGLLNGGLNILNTRTKEVVHYLLDTLKPEHRPASVQTLMLDRKKRIWIGTKANGILYYDLNKNFFHHFYSQPGDPNGITSNDIQDIFEDKEGTIWFATMGGGLSKLVDESKGRFGSYTVQDGLSSNNIFGILDDDEGNLWLSTDQGISRFTIREKKFVNFDAEDRVQSKGFNTSAKLKSLSGYIFFGGVEGFTMFDPDSIQINSKIPPIVITDFKIFNHSIEPNQIYKEKIYLANSIIHSDQVELSYEDNVFSLEFAALNFISPQKNKYAYKLEGFDDEWTYVNSDKRFATYTNLNPGEYTFKVIGSNNDGVWNSKGASLKIIILPPWWMTYWFKILVFLSILAGVLGLIYVRTRFIKERNKFLTEEVKRQTQALEKVNFNLQEKNEIISSKTSRILEQQDEILKQRDKLEQLNKTKDKLFSIIAHDLRNPVNSLTVLSKMLKKEFQHDSDPREEILNNIEISSERLKSVLLNLLEWYKSQTGNIKVDPIKISVCKLIEENIQLHITQAAQKDIQVRAEINMSHYIYADYNMVSTIVRNILSNNIKYTPKGGQVTISSDFKHGKNMVLAFKDTGKGMAEEVIHRILNTSIPFSTEGTEKELGSGIGLVVSKEFAELNHGIIDIVSEEGSGSTFYLALPGAVDEFSDSGIKVISTLESYSPEEVVEEKYIKDEFKGKKILVVDDDEQVRNVVKYILSDSFEVSEVMDVKSAIKVSEEFSPDLIISDIVMPGETGISFCQYLKSNKLTCHIPVILLTGQASDSTQLEGLQAGADAYITKPFDRKIFLTTINNLLTSMENIKIRFSTNLEILPMGVAKSQLDQELLSKVIKYIEENISNPDLNADIIGKEIGISKSLLYIKIKKLTGQTVNEFIRIIRLKMSIPYLLEGKLKVVDISNEIGFGSASYFSRSFTRHFGLSPKDYVSKFKT